MNSDINLRTYTTEARISHPLLPLAILLSTSTGMIPPLLLGLLLLISKRSRNQVRPGAYLVFTN